MAMKYDDVYDFVGHMGRLQWLIYAVMFLLNVFCMDFLNMIFVGGEMDHWCRIDALSTLPPERQRYIAIPSTSESNDDVTPDVIKYSKCEMFDVNWTTYGVEELAKWNRTEWTMSNNASISRCREWNYDQSIFTSTIVSSFDLVCGHEILVELSITISMVGLLCGTVTSGLVSDRFGRKVSLVISLSLKTIGAAIAIFSREFSVFVIGRFISSAGTSGCFLTSFVLVMEMAGPKSRTLVGAGMQLAYSFGFMMSPAVAYFLRDEFTLQLATMSPALLVIPFVIWMPESARWLVVESKFEEGRKVLQRLCKANGTALPDDVDLSHIETQDSSVENRGCSALLRSRTMSLRTAIMLFSWFTAALVYCALSMFSTHQNVSSSLYLSTFINGAIEVPVNAAAIWIIDWKPLGRRWTGCVSLAGAGITSFACALSIWNDYSICAMVMSLLGKGFVTLAYSVVYVYGSEIFPTEVRNVGMGWASMFECFGGIVAPLIAGPMKRLWLPMPSIFYGVIASISGVSYIFLPETLGKPLLDTIDQADNMAAEEKRKKKKKKTNYLSVDVKVTSPDQKDNLDLSTPVSTRRVDMQDTNSKNNEEKLTLRQNEITDNEFSNGHLRDTVI